jgi:hypothetical protein
LHDQADISPDLEEGVTSPDAAPARDLLRVRRAVPRQLVSNCGLAFKETAVWVDVMGGPGLGGIDNGTPVVRRVRKARGLSQTAQLPKGI